MTQIQASSGTELNINELQPNPLQPRGVIKPDELIDLVESIREHGVLEPLVIAQTPAGYQIIAGERRWRASKIAGLEMVPVVIKKTSPQGMLEMALVENVQRSDLNPLERAKAFERLGEEFRLGAAEIGDRIGKSTSYVSNTIRLLELPDAIKDGILTGLITEGHARALSGIKDPKIMIEGYKMILKEGRFGKFLACENYPKCPYSKNMIEKETFGQPKYTPGNKTEGAAGKGAVEEIKIEEKCPKCNGNLTLRQSRFGKFLGCATYPKCKFTKHYKP